mmetsp:Transcript_15417/g.38393  ORF Transcript_15417/g.38393 Transcript_15417/m.38393 type:complete len:261 (-) Transcript_15417:1617-2399(-)
MPARRALLVPAPTRPSDRMAAPATSPSRSWLSLDSVSSTRISGLLMLSSASASGTARLTAGSPYCSACSSARPAMVTPSGSAMATSARPSTAAPWCAAFQPAPSSAAPSMCSPATARNSCTLSTLPVPAYAHPSRHSAAKRDTRSLSVLTTSPVASAWSCLPRNSRPRPRHSCLAAGVASSTSLRHMSACSTAITISSLQLLVNTRPSASAAHPATSRGTSGSPTRGTSSSEISSRCDPAYARPRPRMAPVLTCTSGLAT